MKDSDANNRIKLLKDTTVSGNPSTIFYAKKKEDIERLSENALIVMEPIEEWARKGMPIRLKPAGGYLLSTDNGKSWKLIHYWARDYKRIRQVVKEQLIGLEDFRKWEKDSKDSCKIKLLEYTTVGGYPSTIFYAKKKEDIERLSEDLLIVMEPLQRHITRWIPGGVSPAAGYLLGIKNGKDWRLVNYWTEDYSKIKETEKNKQIAFKKRKEYEKKYGINIEICSSCATKGKLGIMWHSRIGKGSYEETRVWTDFNGLEQSGDVTYYFERPILKCDKCGKEDFSIYA